MIPRALAKRPRRNRPRVWVVNPARAGFFGWLFRYYAFALLLLLVALLVVGQRILHAYVDDLEGAVDLAALEHFETAAPGVSRIHAADGTLLAELAREYRSYARREDIPDTLAHAFLAVEDRRFYSHGGLDLRGLARATVVNLRSGTVIQGGSTITQQVAKSLLTSERTLDRKLKEALLSVRLEALLTKDEILEIYLNQIFFGHNAHGVTAAARRYFDKSLDELTLAESALIAGLARAPSRYNPVRDPERAMRRRATVLNDMVEVGFITAAERDAANAEPIVLATPPEVFRLRDPYYAEHVRKQVGARLGEDAVLHDGLQIETPEDLQMSRWAHESIDKSLRKIDRRQGYRGPVAHIAAPEKRAAFGERSAAEYGADPLRADPRRWRLALVTAVDPKGASVQVGGAAASLPLARMSWAAPYNRNTGINDQKISRADAALEVGDVVWVRGVVKKAAAGAKEPKEAKGDDEAAEDDDEADASPVAAELMRDRKTDLPLVELGQTPRMEAAIYTMDPETGYVAVMQGGHDYDRSQFNRTTQACRQPGSVFKAIYYSLALDSPNWAMDTVLDDAAYEPEPGEVWNPQNIGKTLDGKVLLRTALIRSLNLPSIRLFRKLGADAVVDWARRLGFTSELIADRALSLGASCVHIDELSRAFTIFLREGAWIEPIYVRRIIDKRGRVLVDDRHPEDPRMDVRGRIDRIGGFARTPPRQVIDRRTAFLITRLLREVVTAGIGYHAQHIGVPAGGKTGTASKGAYTTDTWFVGFTSEETTAAWMGDDTYERSMGDEDA
ncbi:MAG: PBP1A family penicillin-binding protein, partial [Nannocystaceae bacterium]